MRKIKEVLRLHHEVHLSERRIADICLVGKGTVQRYLEKQRLPGWPGLWRRNWTTRNWRSCCFLHPQRQPGTAAA